MTIAVTFPSAGGQSGSAYTVPEPADTFGQSLTDYLVQVASKALTAPASADLDLGAAFGIKSLYFKTRTANPAAAGILRLAAADSFGFRNQANGADLLFTIDSGNALLFNGANVTGQPMLGASTGAGQSIAGTGVAAIVVFGTVERDSDSAYNSGTGRFTVPTGKGGDYLITGQIAFNLAVVGLAGLSIYKNAVQMKLAQFTNPTASSTIPVSGILNLAAGDIIDLRASQNSGGALLLNVFAPLNYIALKRVAT